MSASSVENLCLRLKPSTQVLAAFYSRPLGWGAAICVSAMLSYVGGGLMYWLHAIYRGEQGPAIDHWQHWALDSTLGFVALTPIVFLLLPLVLWSLRRSGGRVRVGLYVVMVGTLFALVTGPGPLLHNTLVGKDTPLADAATSVFGYDSEIAEHQAHTAERSAFTEGVLQVAVGIPAYSLLTLAAIMLVRAAVRTRRPENVSSNPQPAAGAAQPRAG